MTADEVVEFVDALYQEERRKNPQRAYQRLSAFLEEAKQRHISDYQGKDTEQSWRSIKGKAFEGIVQRIIKPDMNAMGLALTKPTETPNYVKNKIKVDYNSMNKQEPDMDLVVFQRTTMRVLAIVSLKVSLRERIAQTAYWTLKMRERTDNSIKVFLITLDEDNDFAQGSNPTSKIRAIASKDVDDVYVLSEKPLLPSKNIKPFHQFIDNMKRLCV